MNELQREIEQKRHKLNILAEQHRAERDKLNAEARHWANVRDELNDKVRNLVDRANRHKESRDRLNQDVQEAKRNRDEWNRKVTEQVGVVNKLKKKYLPRDGTTISRLKKEMKNLEFRQMTSVMTPEKEKELLELLSDIQQQIKEREEILKDNEEVHKAMEEERKAKAEAEKYHRLVSEVADKAQVEHDAMLELFFERDRFRKEADRAQEKFVEAKTKADEQHQAHLDVIRKVHDFDKILTGMTQRRVGVKEERGVSTVKRTAEDIFERFKKGEKLSTEDLMSLQKAGYI